MVVLNAYATEHARVIVHARSIFSACVRACVVISPFSSRLVGHLSRMQNETCRNSDDFACFDCAVVNAALTLS